MGGESTADDVAEHRHDSSEPEHGHGSGPMDEETARCYVEEYGDHATNRMTVERAGLQCDDVVLDIGCGSGTAMREAATRLPSGRVFGVDPTPTMVQIAAQKTAACDTRDRIEFFEADAAHLPLPDASVTVAWAINSLHHWDDVPAGLAEARRVLAAGGRFLVTEEEEAGRCANCDGALSDPDTVVETIEESGFVDVTATLHVEGEVRMLLFAGRRS